MKIECKITLTETELETLEKAQEILDELGEYDQEQVEACFDNRCGDVYQQIIDTAFGIEDILDDYYNHRTCEED